MDNGRWTDYLGGTGNEGAMLVIEALLDAGYEFADNDGLAFLHGGKIEGDVGRGHAVLGSVGGVVVLLGSVQKRFSRNTTDIEAGTADGVLLKENDIFAGFGGFFGSCVSGRAASYYCKKIFHIFVKQLNS